MISLLRWVSLTFLWAHGWLYLSSLLDISFLAGGFVLSILLAFTFQWLKLRWLLVLPILILTPFILHGGLQCILQILGGSQTSTLDLFSFLLDKNFPGYALLIVFGCLFNLLTLRSPKFVLWERLLLIAFLALVFWAQGQYNNPLGLEPLLQMLLTLGFVLSELGILFFVQRKKQTAGAKWRGSASMVPLFFRWLIGPVGLVFALFFVFHQYQDRAVLAGGGLLQPQMDELDLAQVIQLESEVKLNKDLVLLYREEGSPGTRYLRRMVFAGYDQQKGFYVAPSPDPLIDELVPRNTGRAQTWPTIEYKERSLIRQEYYLVGMSPQSLLALADPLNLKPLQMEPGSSFKTAYVLESQVPHGLYWEPTQPPVFPRSEAWNTFYTEYGKDEKIHRLALSVTKNKNLVYDQVAAIQKYLFTEFYYSLKPGIAADGNQMHHFLFESRKGYCTYFAYAMTLMLRSLGIPSRVAVGFFTKSQLEVMNFYPILGDQAHAWVEVWFDDRGWITYDPTSQNLAPGEEQFQEGEDRTSEILSLVTEILSQNTQAISTQIVDENPHAEQNLWIPFLLIVFGAYTLYRLSLFLLQVRLGFLKPYPLALWSWRFLQGYLTDAGYPRQAAESLENWLKRLDNHAFWSNLALLYQRAFYASVSVHPQSLELLKSYLQAKKQLKKVTPFRLRFLRVFFPRLPWRRS